ncbi:BglG family transcription antiterminator [Gilliamella sp. B14448G11]|uniref:BglG family transcription antiterminator n=1 Tax=unclassified Gilliamella TaxID=2685620 RepID=UPI0018DB8E86|nr:MULTISPECIES: BglG family transcription antiterminator [unclassified Gilliamella]MBI0027841.1 BglG family transcription antiterminator [Gilliamella sp. B14448G7]MBI0034423.1 BglG family transcription antiterminator [Gilliamella sp. B14448G11]MBI0041647.1 BglG family transcription antiterminator [Gilliamella sp. B14448G12]
MSKFSYQRLDDLFDFFLLKKEPILIKDIASTINVSERTIRTDISNLNDYLIDKNAKIKLIRQKGYILDCEDEKKIIDWWGNFNKTEGYSLLGSLKERQNYLFALLLNEQKYYSVYELMEHLCISKNTLYMYLKNIRKTLSNYNLKLINNTNTGFKVIGTEYDKRKAILDLFLINDLQSYLVGFTDLEKLFLTNIDLDLLKTLESKHLYSLQLLDSDFYHKNIISTIALAIARVKEGLTINEISIEVPKLMDHALDAIYLFLKEIENSFSITLPINEINYFILTLSINVPRLIKNPKNHPSESSIIVDELLTSIYETSNLNWTKDKILFEDLVNHIENFIKISSIDKERKNPILSTIINSFPFAYSLSLTHLGVIGKKYNIFFSEDEVGYIALHIAGAIERHKAKTQQLNVIIVCGGGFAMSKIIESKINKKFPNKFNIKKTYSYAEFQLSKISDIDLTITTLPFTQENTPTIYIDMSNIDKAIDDLKYYLTDDQINNNVMQLFNPENFYYFDTDKLSKKDLLVKMAVDLEKQNIVSADFVSSVLERESLQTTLINDVIAIPHSMTMIANRSRVSVAIFPNGIQWEKDKKCNFIFLLAISKTDNEITDNLYDLILNLIDDKAMTKQLLKAYTFHEFKNLLSIL